MPPSTNHVSAVSPPNLFLPLPLLTTTVNYVRGGVADRLFLLEQDLPCIAGVREKMELIHYG